MHGDGDRRDRLTYRRPRLRHCGTITAFGRDSGGMMSDPVLRERRPVHGRRGRPAGGPTAGGGRHVRRPGGPDGSRQTFGRRGWLAAVTAAALVLLGVLVASGRQNTTESGVEGRTATGSASASASASSAAGGQNVGLLSASAGFAVGTVTATGGQPRATASPGEQAGQGPGATGAANTPRPQHSKSPRGRPSPRPRSPQPSAPKHTGPPQPSPTPSPSPTPLPSSTPSP
jgi:hypothetical protein